MKTAEPAAGTTHDVDQFQVIVSGDGRWAACVIPRRCPSRPRKPTARYSGRQGTGRAHERRAGRGSAQFGRKSASSSRGHRAPAVQSSQDRVPGFVGDVSLQAIHDSKDPQGTVRLLPAHETHATTIAPDTSGTGGHTVLVRGSYADGKNSAPSHRLRGAGERQVREDAGPEGVALSAQLPPQRCACRAAGLRCRRLRPGVCVLCAFVYDEAEEMPDEGVARASGGRLRRRGAAGIVGRGKETSRWSRSKQSKPHREGRRLRIYGGDARRG